MDLDKLISQANEELSGVGESSSSSSFSGINLDNIIQSGNKELLSGPVVPEDNSNVRAVANAGVRGLGSFLGFVDEFNPIDLGGAGFKTPSVFGLFGDDNKEDFSHLFERVGQERGFLSDDVPTTETAKLLANVAEQAGAAAPFGPTALVSNALLGGFGAYGGETVAPSLGISPQTGKLIGSLGLSFAPSTIKGAITKGSELLGPLTEGGRKAAIGRLVRSSATSVDDAGRAIVSALDSPSEFSPFLTGAEAAKDVGLSRLEDAAKVASAGETLSGLDAVREAKRAELLNSMFEPSISKIERSKAIESAIGQSIDNVSAIEDAAWEALPKEAPVRIPDQIQDIENAINEYTLGVDDAPSNIKTLFGKIKRLDWQPEVNKAGEAYERLPPATMGEVQKLRSLAGKVLRGSSDPIERAIAKQITIKLEEGVLNSVSGEAADIWKAARQVTAEKNAAFKATPMLGRASGLNKGEVFDAGLLNEGLNSPDKFSALLNAAKMGGVDITNDVQGALLQSITEGPQSKWIKEFGKREAQFSEAFTPDEIGKIKAVLDDISSQGEKYKRTFQATKGQSATAPRQEIVKSIKKAKGVTDFDTLQKYLPAIGASAGAGFGGFTPAGIATTIAGSLIGKGAQSIAERGASKFDDLLLQTLKNPEDLALALKEPAQSLPGQIGNLLAEGSRNAAGAATQIGVNKLFSSLKDRGNKNDDESNPTLSSFDLSGVNVPTSPTPEPTITGEEFSLPKEVTGESMTKPDETFLPKVEDISANLGIDPQDLLAVMSFETGGSLDSAEKNRAGSGATGLIQFMPTTAKNLTGAKTKEAALEIMASMTPTEQLDYVEKYLSPFKGKLKTLEDLYMAVLWPKAIGKDSNYALFREGTKAFAQNAGLDINDDGIVTKAEAAHKVKQFKV